MQAPEASSSRVALLELIAGSWTTRALHVAARFGIADDLAPGPRSAAALAESLGALRRLLRALTSLGVTAEPVRGVFALTPLGAHLRADAPDSVRSWALFWGGSLLAHLGDPRPRRADGHEPAGPCHPQRGLRQPRAAARGDARLSTTRGRR
jgi:hypothetical protein